MLLQDQEPLPTHGIAKRLFLGAQRRQRGAQELDDTSNVLHKACGGWQLLSGAPKGFGAPTGEGRIEDFQRIGPENRLKVLAAEKTCSEIHEGAPLALHMLCANPHVSVDAVKFVGNLYPAAAAIPTSKSCGAFNCSHHFHDVLPLHLLCLNTSITPELFQAVASLYPAALDAECVEDAGNQVQGLYGDAGPQSRRHPTGKPGSRFQSAPLKPLDLLNTPKTASIAARCSKLVEGIRELPSPPEATAMAEELAAIKRRKAELERLGKLAPEELKTHTSTLAAMIEDADKDMRASAMMTLSKLAQEDLASHTAAITGRLEDADTRMRAAVVTIVGKLAREDPATHTATLAAKLEDADGGVRSAAIRALHELAPEDLAPHTAAIAAKLDDKRHGHGDDDVWCLVLHTLGKLAPDELAPHTAAFEAKLRHIQSTRSKKNYDDATLEPEEVSELEAKLEKAKGAVAVG